MANDLTNYAKSKIINMLASGTSITAPALYAALLTTDPSDDDMTGAVEVSGGSYAREAISAGAFPTSSSGNSVANATEIAFTQATASWGTVTSVAFVEHVSDAISSTNCWGWKAVTNQTVSTGEIYKFDVGDLTFQSTG